MSARRITLVGSALLAALTVAWAGTGLAEDRVGIRAAEFDGYARLVFDWPEPVAFAAATRGRNLWVRFDRSFHGDPAAIVANLGRYVAGARLAEDRKGLDIVLTGAYRASSFAQGNEVVFELRPAGAAAVAPRPAAFTDRSRAADSAAPTLPVRVGAHDTFLRLVFDWAKPVDYEVEETAAAVRLRFNRAARVDVAALRRRLPPELAKLDAKSDNGALVVTLPRQPGRQVRHFKSDTKVVLDFVRISDKAAAPPPSPAPTPPAAAVAAAPKQAEESVAAAPVQPEQADPPSQDPPAKAAPPEAAEPPPPQAAPVPEVQQGAPKAEDSGEKGVSLVFEWPEPVGAAVFQREPYVWVVFDKRAQLNLAALRDAGAEVVDLIEQLPVGSGTVVRMIPKKGLNPVVALEGSNWVVRFREAAISPQVPIAIRVRPEAEEGTQLELPVSEFGRIIRIPDPDVGDMIVAATLRAPGHGLAGQRRYPEFGLLASAQGVGVETFSDDVDVRDGGDRGLIIAAPGGLHISSVSEGAEKSGSSFLGPRIFNLENWFRGKGEPFITARQAMFEAVADAKEERRDDARLDLARFYFARGYGPEALGVLRTIEYANTDMASLPEFRAMKSAVLVYMGRAQEARKVLLDPSLDQYQEISLWRGSMLLQTGEAKKAAAHFRSGEPVLQTYPEPMKTKLAIELTEASLADLDLETATLWLDQLGQAVEKMQRDQAARVLYDRGVLARDSRKLDEAVELWTKARKGADRWAAAHAEHALVDLGLQQETIEPAEAIERLDRLRYQWRGDDLELKVLRRLGGLYLTQNDYRKGLNTLRTAVTYFPEREEVKEIAQTMAESFRNLHLGGEADRLPPLKALALYDDFRELTPAGPEGDLMIQRLADRLVAVDLLDRAASLLGHQIRFRLKGEERARVGAKLAFIMLLDRNPKGALSALRNSFQPSLPLDLEDDRRRIRARATMDIGRYEEAIALLAGDVSREADLLRAHIYWNTKDYSEAAKVLQRLSGDPRDEGSYSEEQARYILSWAVALQLKRDEAGVKMLRQLYGPGMTKSKLGDAFAYIASETPAGATDIEEMSRRIAEGDKFDGFLKNYRERLMTPIAVSPKDGKEVPAADADKATPPADAGASPAAPSAAPAAIPPPPPPPRG